MLALQPLHQYLDQLLAYTHAYTRTTRVTATTQAPTVSRLWVTLSFLPVEIICSVLDNDPEPPTGTDEPPKLATHEWLLHAMETLDPEPLEEINIIDLAKARQQRQNRLIYSKGEHLHPRQRAIIAALAEAGFEYTGIDDEIEGMEDGICLGGFGISEEFDHGYWIAVQNLETLDTWGFPLDEETHDLMSIQKAVQIIGDAIQAFDTLDQIPLPLPEPTPATVQADYIPPIPDTAFRLVGSKGQFAIKPIDGGALIGRWVNQKTGEKFSRHFIPTDGNCDCKAAQLGHNCCHSKALEHYLYTKKEAARIERERERDRLELLNRNRYQVLTGNDTDHGSFSSELHAVAKLEVLSYQGFDVRIYDRIEDKIIRSYTQPRIAAS